MGFPAAGAFCAVMRAAGLVGVTYHRLAFGAAHIYVGIAPVSGQRDSVETADS